ncbi:MAG TPA: hypothetical protein VGW76_11050 [Pyrinomonadaceae bacterium]|nr:hypothetical protein [Pyrinomonadaceae bacterium]
MKRYAAVVISLLAVVILVTGVFGSMREGQTMQVRFNKRDLPKHEVQIITSADPSFEAMVASYFKTQSKTAKDLEPFSVFIKNSGNRTVVAYMLLWQLVRADGRVLTNRTAYSEPAMLMGEETPTDPRFKHTQAIEPNTVKCFSWSAPIAEGEAGIGSTQDLKAMLRQGSDERNAAIRSQLTTELTQATDLTVSLDGVFFDDGSFVGPNTTGFFERMQAIVQAKLDLLRDIAAAATEGKEDEVFDVITAKSLEPDSIITSTASPEDYYKYYTKLFATELSGMKSFYGKQKLVPHLKKLHERPRPVLKMEVWEER